MYHMVISLEGLGALVSLFLHEIVVEIAVLLILMIAFCGSCYLL